MTQVFLILGLSAIIGGLIALRMYYKNQQQQRKLTNEINSINRRSPNT